MKRSTEILSNYLNGKISREQMQSEINKREPLIFEVEIDTPHSNPKNETVGFYEHKGEKIYKPYSWFVQEKVNRDVAICVQSPINI